MQDQALGPFPLDRKTIGCGWQKSRDPAKQPSRRKTTHTARTNRYGHSTSPEQNSAPVQGTQRNTIQCRLARNHHQTFQWGELSPKKGKQQQWKLPCDSWNVPWESLESRILLRGLRNVPVYWQPLTNSKREMTGLKALRPCFFLSQDTRPKTLPSQAQRACPSQLLCWPWALDCSESSAAVLRRRRPQAPLLFQSDFSLGPSDQASQRGKSVRFTQGGVGWGETLQLNC